MREAVKYQNVRANEGGLLEESFENGRETAAAASERRKMSSSCGSSGPAYLLSPSLFTMFRILWARTSQTFFSRKPFPRLRAFDGTRDRGPVPKVLSRNVGGILAKPPLAEGTFSEITGGNRNEPVTQQ